MRSITVRHNFETAHRLPLLGGRCTSLHGHSWWAEVKVAAPDVGPDGTVVEFGEFKRAMRAWIDTYLDHGTMLGETDPLVSALEAEGCKVFAFGRDWDGAAWPTVEAAAELIADQAAGWLSRISGGHPEAYVARVQVTETVVNAAEWVADALPGRFALGGHVWTKAATPLRETA